MIAEEELKTARMRFEVQVLPYGHSKTRLSVFKWGDLLEIITKDSAAKDTVKKNYENVLLGTS